MSDDFVKNYQELREDFLLFKNLDEDEEYWTEEDHKEWKDIYQKFLKDEGREPLL